MRKTGKVVLLIAAFIFAVVPLLSQTSPAPKPSFEVISIKPSAPNNLGIRGGGARGDRYTMTGATLRMLLQNGLPAAVVGSAKSANSNRRRAGLDRFGSLRHPGNRGLQRRGSFTRAIAAHDPVDAGEPVSTQGAYGDAGTADL